MRLLRLAWSDLRHEWPTTLCAVLGVAVALAPLLILFSLKYGVVSALLNELREDPRTREIRLVGQGELTRDWFNAMGARADVGFVVPMTRFLTASIDVSPKGTDDADPLNVELYVTADGDPLVEGYARQPTSGFEAVLSGRAAEQLYAVVGDELEGRIGRLVEGQREEEKVRLKVVGVLPPGRKQSAAFFVTLPFLVAVENFREGSAPFSMISEDDVDVLQPSFASFRLYARSVYDVTGLRDWMSQEGHSVLTRATEIDRVLKLDGTLSNLFTVVSVLTGSGLMLSVALGFWASVARKRRELSVLRLIGFSKWTLACFPLFQALTVAAIGALAAVAVYRLSQPVIRASLESELLQGASSTGFSVAQIAVVVCCTAMAAALAAVSAGWRVARFQISEGLRDE